MSEQLLAFDNGWKMVFETTVGSRLFGDETPTSDYDTCLIYAVPTRDILSERPYPKTLPQKKFVIGEERHVYEVTYWEVGHLLHQLIKGNQNAIWMVCGKMNSTISKEHRELKEIVASNLSKVSYHSVKGMATSQYEDAYKRNLGSKGLRSAWRTARFGITLLTEEKLEFNPTPNIIHAHEVEEKIRELDRAFEESKLPEFINPGQFHDWLYRLRLKELTEEEEIFTPSSVLERILQHSGPEVQNRSQ
jgi:hypothetical protein